MPANKAEQKKSPTLQKAALTVALIWTLLVSTSLLGNFYQHHLITEAIVLNVARTHLEKDILFRKWIVRHGGVYVPVTKESQPNPYLKPEFFPERDITTPSGRPLTLINPAYMIRQLYKSQPNQDPFYPHAKISSLNPVRPGNIADPWEREALREFSKGAKVKSELVEENGKELIRLMRPLIAAPGCLAKCHTVTGYKKGDVMGGVSVTVPMAPFNATARNHTITILIAHLTLWLLVLGGIALAFAGMHKRNLARQRSEEALRDNEEHFRSLIENALDIITVLDLEGRTIFSSPSIQRILGHKPSKMLKQPLAEILHPEDQDRVSKVLAHLANQPGSTETFEMRCRHNDGSWRTLEAVGQLMPANLSPATYVINSRDISNRKHAEEKLFSYQGQLRSLASRLSQAEEETRHAIATGLHEQIGQNLSVLKLKLEKLITTPSPEAMAQLHSFSALLDTTIKETRTLTFELSPPILYDLGLEAAITWGAEQFQTRHNIACQVTDDGRDKPIDDDLRGVLFRSVQEALLNISKYAEARQVTIAIQREDKYIRVDITDDGKGFNQSKQESLGGQSSGFGLFSIQERLDLLGGHLKIISDPGQGTKLAITAPLKLDDSG